MADPNDAPLPPMSDAVLDAQQLAALFGDYHACLDAVEILVKRGPGYASDGPQPSLSEAQQLLAAGAVRGLQVRYRYQGAQWCDTLLPVEGGVRLVRIAHPADA
jgi:hypothetical protein